MVLASEGCPASPIRATVTGIPESDDVIVGSSWINHAGTKCRTEKLLLQEKSPVVYSNGSSLEKAVQSAYGLISKISLEGSHYRTDVGAKAMSKSSKNFLSNRGAAFNGMSSYFKKAKVGKLLIPKLQLYTAEEKMEEKTTARRNSPTPLLNVLLHHLQCC